MKKVIAILMLFVVLLGTVTKDMSASKAVKSTYSLSDDSDKDDSPQDDSDSKDVTGKELANKFHIVHPAFLFTESICATLFSRVTLTSAGIENPYLESISLPPEVIS